MDTQTIMNNGMVRKSAVAVLVLLAVFLGAKTIGEVMGYQYIGGGVPSSNTISVSGEGEVLAKPNLATFSFAVAEERTTVAAAQEAATEKINNAIDFLEGEGIAEEDIKTTGYQVYPRYDYIRQSCFEGYCPPGEQRLRGFEVRQSVEVKVRELENVGALFSGLGNVGISEMSSLSFTVEDDEALREEAREKAIANAREKAEKLADALGVNLVRVVSFHESGSPGIPVYSRVEGLGGGDAAVSAPQIPAGENEIISNVTVTYEIR